MDFYISLSSWLLLFRAVYDLTWRYAGLFSDLLCLKYDWCWTNGRDDCAGAEARGGEQGLDPP
jgi:hypothetical protein